MAATPEAEGTPPGLRNTQTGPWRLFIAIELPEDVRQALREPLEALSPLTDWMRTSPLEQIHLTLHFLGSVDVDRVSSIVAALPGGASGHQRFELSVRGIGTFGGLRRPRVLWAGFEERGLADLKALRRDTGQALARLGFNIDPDFTPHLTLARSRRPMDDRGRVALGAWYAQWKDKSFGLIQVQSVQLMRSQLGSGPARHSILATSELQ